MDRFELAQLKAGEKLLVKTETGSTYHLLAETEPVPLSSILFRGFRATRESNHNISGRPEVIEDEAALLITHSREDGGVLCSGDSIEIAWDRDHPDYKNWDWNAGALFQTLRTSRILDIELVPVSVESETN